MSGPIVRKYGFPNFEKIFGERDIKHGAEGESIPPPDPKPETLPPTNDASSDPGKTGTAPPRT